MKKNFSIASLIAVAFFLAATFSTAKFTSNIGTEDKFGFPVTFFSAYNEGEIISNIHFSITGFIFNFSICFVLAYAVVFCINMLKVERKENNLAH